jgi:hypothetical protein
LGAAAAAGFSLACIDTAGIVQQNQYSRIAAGAQSVREMRRQPASCVLGEFKALGAAAAAAGFSLACGNTAKPVQHDQYSRIRTAGSAQQYHKRRTQCRWNKTSAGTVLACNIKAELKPQRATATPKHVMELVQTHPL